MPYKFEVGDRVICMEDYQDAATEGKVGTVIYSTSYSPLVEYDDVIHYADDPEVICGHDGERRGSDGHCWWTDESILAPHDDYVLPEVSPNPDFISILGLE